MGCRGEVCESGGSRDGVWFMVSTVRIKVV